MMNKHLILFLFLLPVAVVAQKRKKYDAIYSGIPWFDDKGNSVGAHGANIIKDNGKFYLFGEKHSDTSNAFAGFSCYSSNDLYNWKFESLALPVQQNGKLGPNRVGERPKVMKSPATGEYVMFMHVDTLGYRDQYIGYATSTKITGPFVFRGPILFNGNPIRKWDMGSFQDIDGAGYLLVHGGDIYKLANDYKSISEQVLKNMSSECESPAVFRKDSIYYWLSSHRTSWERNDNFYYTAPSLKGPWTYRGNFAPEGTLTWNSQISFVLPIQGAKETTYMFMGDRWSFPKQASAATYVWQPLRVSGTSLSLPEFWSAWQLNMRTGEASPLHIGKEIIDNTNSTAVTYSGEWNNDTLSARSSDVKNASFTVKFTGTQIGVYGIARPDGGYAQVTITDSRGNKVLSSMVDMYSKKFDLTLKFLTPVLSKDRYVLTVTVMGERGNWSDKRRSDYGSTGYVVSLERIVIN